MTGQLIILIVIMIVIVKRINVGRNVLNSLNMIKMLNGNAIKNVLRIK